MTSAAGAATDAEAALSARLQAYVGQPVGSGSHVGPDPVNQPMIRHWAAAFEDHNPVYTDPDAAARSRWGGIVAPPLMLQTWTMATPVITGIAERGGAPVESSTTGAIAVLDDAGYTGTLAANSEFAFERYLRPGDVVTAETVMESISEPKTTRLGRGFFLTWVTTFTVDGGAVAGRQRFRIFKFRPPGHP